MEKEERNSNFERGEMVWARVVYRHQWWPGVVIRQDSLGVLVSFSFNNKNNINSQNCPRCRYFIESEVVSFEPNFKSLVRKCTNDDLLNRALKRSGKNVLSSLEERRRSDLFRPREVLGFARGAAVSSWIEVVDYLDAANAFAQFTAFRRHFFSSASEADPAAALDAGDDCREFSEKGEDNMLACLTNVSNISDISPEVSLSRWGKDQLEVCSMSETERQKIQPFQDMMVKLQTCALDTFFIDGECLNTLKLNFLSFRSLSCESTSDNLIESDEARLFNPGYIMFQQGIRVRGGKGNTTLPIAPSMESPINCLGLKRQLDQSSSVSEPPLKLHNSLSFSLNRAEAYLWRSNEGFKAFKSLFSRSLLDFTTQSPSAIVAQASASSSKDLDLNLLYFSLLKYTTSHCSNQKIIEISTVQNPDETVQTVDNRVTHIPSINVQQPEDCGSVMENQSTLISYANDITEKLMQTPAQSMSNNKIGIHTNGTSTVTRGTWNLHSHRAADELKMMHCSNVPSKDSFKKKKKLLKPLTSSTVNSKVGQQWEVPTLAVSRSLLMKFPKDFSLPSKEELVRKFSPFGLIDCLNTKVYFYTGSARVVFLHQLDAMAAYQYAKRKKIAFGKADVKFWLDTLQDKRESKNLVSSPSCAIELPGFNIRSCLKKSRVLEKEGKSSRKKVRFLMEN